MASQLSRREFPKEYIEYMYMCTVSVFYYDVYSILRIYVCNGIPADIHRKTDLLNV